MPLDDFARRRTNMKNFRLWLIAGLLMAMAIGPVFAGIADDVGFKAGKVNQLDDKGSTLTEGTIGGKTAKHLKSVLYGMDAVFVTLDEVKTWNAAYGACAAFAPQGTWQMPQPAAALGAFYLGILETRQVGEIGGQPVATPPALWAQGEDFSQNVNLQGTSIAMTFQKGVVGVDEQGRQQVGWAPQLFDIAEAVKGNTHKIEEMKGQLEELKKETPESLAGKGYEGVTQEQLDATIAKLAQTIKVQEMVVESLKKGIPVICVAGIIPTK